MRRNHTFQLLIGLAVTFLANLAIGAPVGTAFTYQGQLKNAGSPVNGNANMDFSLWDAASGGTQQGSTLTFTGGTAVNVASGLFTVQLDFGINPYTANAALWLEISINGTTLSPRQALSPAPFSLNTRGVNVDASGKVGIGTATPSEALEVRSGTSATALRFGGPFGTGSLYAGAGSLGINSNDGTTRLVIDQNNGNVGIGTSNPAVKLEIDGGSDAALAGGGYLQTGVSSGANIVIDNNEIMARNNSASSNLFLNNDGGNVIVDGNGTGNVGIGTTSPIAPLHVVGSNPFPHLKIEASSSAPYGAFLSLDASATAGGKNWHIFSSGGTAGEGPGNLVFQNYSDGSYPLTLTSNGSVGIGTVMPASTLSVAGNADFAGNVGIGTATPASTLSVAGEIDVGGSRLHVDTNGNVGIGTATPATRLHTLGGDARIIGSPTGVSLLLAPNQPGDGNSGTQTVLDLAGDDDGTFGMKWVYDGAANALSLFGHNLSGQTPAHMTIARDTGNVGIGTSSPANRLDVRGGSVLTDYGFGFSSVTQGPIGTGTYISAPAGDTLAIATAGVERMRVTNIGNVGIGSTSPGVPLEVRGNSNAIRFGDAAGVGNLIAGGSYVGLATGDNVTRMVIQQSNGNVGIGTSTPSQKLSVTGNICATGTIGACSDARFKEHIAPVAHALDTVEHLHGIMFDWKHTEFCDHQFAEGRQLGFIAQEVRKVLPQVVSEGSDGYLSVDYGRLTPVIVEAVKQIKSEKDEQIAALKNENAALKTRLDRIESLISKGSN